MNRAFRFLMVFPIVSNGVCLVFKHQPHGEFWHVTTHLNLLMFAAGLWWFFQKAECAK